MTKGKLITLSEKYVCDHIVIMEIISYSLSHYIGDKADALSQYSVVNILSRLLTLLTDITDN